MERLSVLSMSYTQIPSYGDIEIRNNNTGRGFCVLSPWNDSRFTYTLSMINLAYNPISKIEVVSLINLHNLGRGSLLYYDGDHTKKYNPKVYTGYQQSYADGSAKEVQQILSTWPESYQFLSFVAI